MAGSKAQTKERGTARSIRNRLGKPSVAQSLDDLRRLTGSLRFPEKPQSYSEKLRHRKSGVAMALHQGRDILAAEVPRVWGARSVL